MDAMIIVTSGGGNGAKEVPTKPRQPAATPSSVNNKDSFKDAAVAFFTGSDRVAVQGIPVGLASHSVIFELFNPAVTPHLSEALAEFKISLTNRLIYSGRAVIRNILNVGGKVVCEATLDDAAWQELDGESLAGSQKIAGEFSLFLKNWQTFYKITPEFKVIVADMQTFLHDLQLWLNQVEITIRHSARATREVLEQEIIANLSKTITRSVDTFTDRFESIVSPLPAENHPVFQAYLRRQLHPLLLKSPFANRAFNKPLGYAGDYVMVDMMLRSPEEGDDLFAKLINIWLLSQTPAQAHRNRVSHLKKKLVEETLRAKSARRRLQVLNLGCGPAGEIQDFARSQDISPLVDFTLVDFNAETLEFLRRALMQISLSDHPVCFRLLQKSVYQILKEGGRGLAPKTGSHYDYIYCAGLFDYLPDTVCQQLMAIFYELLAPEGLLLVTNASDAMNASRPFRYSMEYFLDWHLIYRNQEQFLQVLPDSLNRAEAAITAETTGANLFLEVRKPAHV